MAWATATRALKRQQPIFVQKTTLQRLTELLNAVQVIRDSLEAMRAGKDYQIIPLSGQLRALLTDRTRHAKPLLLDLAKQFDRPLSVYSTTDVDNAPVNPKIANDVLLRFTGIYFSLTRELPEQFSITIEAALKRNVVNFQGSRHTLEEVVEFFANRAGGAHYSKISPKEIGELLALSVFGMSPLKGIVWQVGFVALRLATELLRSLTEFEIHFAVTIPTQTLQRPGFLVDAVYPGQLMGYSVYLDPLGRIHFVMQDIVGMRVEVLSNRIVPFDKPFHFSIRHTWTDNLESEIEITMEGERAGFARSPRPLFTLAETPGYDILMNSSHQAPNSGLAFCLGDMMMVRVGSVAQRVEILSEMLKAGTDPGTPCIEYEPDEVMHMYEPADSKPQQVSDTTPQQPEGIRLTKLGSYKRSNRPPDGGQKDSTPPLAEPI